MPSVRLKGESKWVYQTSSSGGLGVGLVAVEGGNIVLRNPEGSLVSMRYGAVGGGWSWGLKLPKVGKLKVDHELGGSLSTTDNRSEGKLWILGGCDEDELSKDDLTGVCIYISASGALGRGVSGSVMLLGIDAGLLAGIVVMPVLGAVLEERLIASATALLVTDADNSGLGFGIDGYIGCFV